MSEKNLHYLHELSDYKVASDYPDVRGWEIKDADGRVVGKVDGLLVNKKEKRVVYLDVDVDESLLEEGHEPLATPASEGVHEFLNEDGEDHLIVPIGMVTIDEDNEVVQSNKINSDTFRNAKRFSKGRSIEPEYELIIFSQLSTEGNYNKEIDEDFYKRKEFNDNYNR
ncbi:MAG: PRC-barrel domain-containing protein [Flavisolibacter sp.]|nr:PRC-barrel domain-containing protein [Flavisolibacter sp.]